MYVRLYNHSLNTPYPLPFPALYAVRLYTHSLNTPYPLPFPALYAVRPVRAANYSNRDERPESAYHMWLGATVLQLL